MLMLLFLQKATPKTWWGATDPSTPAWDDMSNLAKLDLGQFPLLDKSEHERYTLSFVQTKEGNPRGMRRFADYLHEYKERAKAVSHPSRLRSEDNARDVERTEKQIEMLRERADEIEFLNFMDPSKISIAQFPIRDHFLEDNRLGLAVDGANSNAPQALSNLANLLIDMAEELGQRQQGERQQNDPAINEALRITKLQSSRLISIAIANHAISSTRGRQFIP